MVLIVPFIGHGLHFTFHLTASCATILIIRVSDQYVSYCLIALLYRLTCNVHRSLWFQSNCTNRYFSHHYRKIIALSYNNRSLEGPYLMLVDLVARPF